MAPVTVGRRDPYAGSAGARGGWSFSSRARSVALCRAYLLCVVATGDIVLEPHGSVTDIAHFNYAVESKLYAERPDVVFVTTRGAGGIHARAANATVTVLSVADPARPRVVESWPAPASVEGQDMYQGWLVVCDIGRGGLYIFDSSCVACGPVSYLDLSIDAVLHVRVFGAADGAVYALATSGFAEHPAGALVAVDISDVLAPREVLVADVGVCEPEGIAVRGGYAYVGGVCDAQLAVVSLLELPAAIPVVQRLRDGAYVQAVSTPRPVGDGSAMLAALWGRPGGLAAFALDAQGGARELGRAVGNRTSRANRVAVERSTAFCPLEAEVGGVAAFDVRALASPRLAAVVDLPAGTCYCLFAKDGYVHAFAAQTSTMHSFVVRPEPSLVL